MSIAQNIAKIAAATAGASLIAVSFAPAAFAQTTGTTTTTTSSTMSASQIASLQAQIAALQAQLSASQGTSMSMSTTFTRDLTIGSTGADVTALQNWLISKGYSIPAGATGYFGAQTRAAVAAWQASAGITPAAGYFGPISRAKVNAMSTTTTTTTTTGGTTTTTTGTTGTLSGGEGSIDNFQVLGSPSNTSLYQGQMQQVYGFQFQADGSDINVNRVDFDVTNNGQTVNGNTLGGQDRPWSLLQTATLYDGSTVIGTVDASNSNNWSQDGTIGTHQTYRLRFDNLNDVVKMGALHNFYVAFTAQNGVSNANQTQYQIVLANQGVRGVDAMGIQQYSSSNTANGQPVNNDAQVFSISNGTAGTVTFSTGSDNPQTSTVMANQSTNTQNVVLSTFTVQANSANTTIYDLPATLFVSNTNINPIQDLKLYEGSTLIDSESVNSTTFATTTTPSASPVAGVSTQAMTTNGVTLQGAVVLFNNLNINIPAGTTQSFSIQADVNPVGGTNSGNAVEGSSALVIVNPTTAGTDIEQGSNRVSATGSSTGNLITFHVNGLSPDAVPTTSATVANNGGNVTSQKGTFSFTFNVTAFGQDVFLNATNTSAYTVTLHNSTAGTTSAATNTALTSTADIDGATGNYVVHSGQSKSVTITATLSNGSGQFYYATLDALKYGLTNNNTLANSATLTSSYRTQPISINS